MEQSSQKFIKSIKSFWEKHEFKVVLLIVLILITSLSFEVGYLKGKGQKLSSVVIEKAPECPRIEPGEPKLEKSVIDATKTNIEPKSTNLTSVSDVQKCPYVGSKNSDKFYPPTCSYAKRIKPENLVCFQTEKEALAQGRARSTGCKY